MAVKNFVIFGHGWLLTDANENAIVKDTPGVYNHTTSNRQFMDFGKGRKDIT